MDGDRSGGQKTTARVDARRNRVKILDAATTVFAQQGASATTESVAALANVAVGTVFRHFPTKSDLVGAVVMNAWDHIVAEVDELVDDRADLDAVIDFSVVVMETAAANRNAFAKLAETGNRVHVGDALTRLQSHIAELLDRAQAANVVRSDLRATELIALLGALCQEAMTAEWDKRARGRALELLFEGLRT